MNRQHIYKTLAFLMLGLLLPFLTQAQSDSVYKYWVTLSDKGGTAYAIDTPQAFLSPRALERRQRQSIAIDSLDLPVSSTYLQQLQQLGFHIQNRSKWLNGVVLFTSDSSRIALLDTLSFVLSYDLFDHSGTALPDIHLSDNGEEHATIPYDTAYGAAYYGGGSEQIAQLHGQALHRAGYQGQGLIVGVCDSGFPGADSIDLFDTLRLEGRLLASRDFVWDGDDVYSIHSHGTSVLSNLASYVPGLYVGTAPKAAYVLCRTENVLSETPLEMINWVSAAEYLDSLGADVITTSLGYYVFDDTVRHYPLDGHAAPITQGAEIAASRGMLVVNAAGNNGAYDPPYLNAPADGEHVLTVGAVDITGEVTSFSSPGPTADNRIKPDVVAMGRDVTVSGTRGYLHRSSGTSFATPILAGMATCLWQRNPGWTQQQLCDTLRAWGSHADNPDNYYGYGLPDFRRAFGAVPAAISPAGEAAVLVVYPNPAQSDITVRVRGCATATLTITDQMGRCCLRTAVTGDTCIIPQGSLAPGIYILTVVTPSGCATQRLLMRRGE